MTDDIKDKNNPISVSLEWFVPDGLVTPFATNMVVQFIENAFKLTFFEMKPPMRIDKTQLPEKIRADYVTSVYVTPDKLLKIIEALQTQYDNYKSRKAIE
jgi:hypothetical protein